MNAEMGGAAISPQPLASGKTDHKCNPKIIKQRRIILSGIGLIVYYAVYLNFRLDHYMIHRKTWASGRNRHWVEPGELIEGPMAILAIMIVAEKNGHPFDAAEEQVLKAIRNSERKQTAFGLLFFPLRVTETFFWYCVDLRD